MHHRTCHLPLFVLTLMSLLTATHTGALAQHAHINAGAVSQTPGSRLLFTNAALFETNSGYYVFLTPQKPSATQPRFQGSITFTALPSTPINGGPTSGHAIPGSSLALRVESVSGPAQAEFGFMEEEDLTPRFTLPTGSVSTTQSFMLSENAGAPGDDPYGHIHGRYFTASHPGLYTVGFRILDVSSNGPSGRPLHEPSEVFFLHFQAGTTIHSISTPTTNSTETQLLVGAQPNLNIVLEATDTLQPSPSWSLVDGPLRSANRILKFTDRNPKTAQRFYRVRGEP